MQSKILALLSVHSVLLVILQRLGSLTYYTQKIPKSIDLRKRIKIVSDEDLAAHLGASSVSEAAENSRHFEQQH